MFKRFFFQAFIWYHPCFIRFCDCWENRKETQMSRILLSSEAIWVWAIVVFCFICLTANRWTPAALLLLHTITFQDEAAVWIVDPHSTAAKKNTSHGNEVLPQDTTHLMQRPCYQRGSPCQDSAGNSTTRRPAHRKDRQTEVIGTCLLFIRSGQNHLARHSERRKKTRQAEKKR